MQNKQEFSEQDKTQALGNLIILKNLIPGQYDSDFVRRFEQNVLSEDHDEEQKNYRLQLLNEIPPKLTFRNKTEEDDFYKKEASSCASFCCETQKLEPNANNNSVSLVSNDNYMLSVRTGRLYEGDSGEIIKQLQKDIHNERFGSSKQSMMLDGLRDFKSILNHEAKKESSEAIAETTKRADPHLS